MAPHLANLSYTAPTPLGKASSGPGPVGRLLVGLQARAKPGVGFSGPGQAVFHTQQRWENCPGRTPEEFCKVRGCVSKRLGAKEEEGGTGCQTEQAPGEPRGDRPGCPYSQERLAGTTGETLGLQLAQTWQGLLHGQGPAGAQKLRGLGEQGPSWAPSPEDAPGNWDPQPPPTGPRDIQVRSPQDRAGTGSGRDAAHLMVPATVWLACSHPLAWRQGVFTAFLSFSGLSFARLYAHYTHTHSSRHTHTGHTPAQIHTQTQRPHTPCPSTWHVAPTFKQAEPAVKSTTWISPNSCSSVIFLLGTREVTFEPQFPLTSLKWA